MGDEDQRQTSLLLQADEHVEDLCAYRHVEHRDRLVADQALGLEHQRGGDRDPLALPAGELMRVAIEEPLGVEPDVAHRPAHPIVTLALGNPLDLERLGDDRADPLAWIEGLVGVLEDHLDSLAQRRAARPCWRRGRR